MNHELLGLIVFALPFLLGLLAVLLAAPLGRSKLFWFFAGALGGLYAADLLSKMPVSKKLMHPERRHHDDIEELFIAKQMFERGEISREQYEDARAELMAKLD